MPCNHVSIKGTAGTNMPSIGSKFYSSCCTLIVIVEGEIIIDKYCMIHREALLYCRFKSEKGTHLKAHANKGDRQQVGKIS